MARRGRKAKLGAIDLNAIGHGQAKPELSEIDNPLYNRAHDGETWNPKKIMGVKNMKESALVVLEQRKLIDEAQAKAGERFRRVWEALGGAGAGSFDYSREPGEWIPNRHGGNENLDAIDFLRATNARIAERHPGTVTIAEESTAFPGVSRPTDEGGLGFNFKWNMGWMHDTLAYMSLDPVHRKFHHQQMTFGMVYAYSENFVLPLSHDEVVHGKGSLLGKMPGDRWQKFANLRAYLSFMWTHPGKKLLFMGGEFGQEREWNHDRSLDWHLLDDPLHKGLQRLVRDLNHLYRDNAALHELDCDPGGFEWIEANDAENSVFSFLRKAKDGAPPVVVICNMTPVVRQGFRIGVPEASRWQEVLNSDAPAYGGSGIGNPQGLVAQPTPWHGRSHSIDLDLPPLGVVVLRPTG